VGGEGFAAQRTSIWGIEKAEIKAKDTVGRTIFGKGELSAINGRANKRARGALARGVAEKCSTELVIMLGFNVIPAEGNERRGLAGVPYKSRRYAMSEKKGQKSRGGR